MDTVETHEGAGPFGAKEAGEGLACPTVPAIVGAVHAASGYCCKGLPITPEKVLELAARVWESRSSTRLSQTSPSVTEQTD